MSDFYEEAIKRDSELVKAFVSCARATRMEMREWAQTELKAVLVEAELQEPRAAGVILDGITGAVDRLRGMNRLDLSNAIKVFDDVIDDVSQGGFTSVNDAYDRLQMGCMGLVQIMKELQQIRDFIGEQGDG